MARTSKPRITAARKAAKGQSCMIRIPGICCHDETTVVLCHYRLASGAGMKPDDEQGAWDVRFATAPVDGRSRRFTRRNRATPMARRGRVQDAGSASQGGRVIGIDFGVSRLITSALVSHYRGTTMNQLANSTQPAGGEEELPTTRALNQLDKSLDQLQDTITSLDKTLQPVLRHAEPDGKSVGGDIREAGVSPIHSTVIEITARVQYAAQHVAALRNRITV
jgi:hypothetical protein